MEGFKTVLTVLLNTVEQWNSVNTYIFYGKNSEMRSNAIKDQFLNKSHLGGFLTYYLPNFHRFIW